MKKYNPNSPWNPAVPVKVTPEEYERQVVAWLRSSGSSLDQFTVNHLKNLTGASGEYEFDAVAKFTIFEGAQITVLVECKRYSRPVEREELLALWAKLHDVNAQKAMMFSTSGFQAGALEYAKSKNIATIAFVEGTFLYETKGFGLKPTPPPWVAFPKFEGIFISDENGSNRSTVLTKEYLSLIGNWLNS